LVASADLRAYGILLQPFVMRWGGQRVADGCAVELGWARGQCMRLAIARVCRRGVEFSGSDARRPIGLLALLLASAALTLKPDGAFAQNLIDNASFETGTYPAAPPWVFTGGAQSYNLSIDAHTGTRSLALESNASVLGTYNGMASESVTLSQSGKYTFIFWYSVISPGPVATEVAPVV
jgi:hypothetical protein